MVSNQRISSLIYKMNGADLGARLRLAYSLRGWYGVFVILMRRIRSKLSKT